MLVLKNGNVTAQLKDNVMIYILILKVTLMPTLMVTSLLDNLKLSMVPKLMLIWLFVI